jgi:hypothetical protein
MQYKYPKVVVTDGDGAMREAIKQIFPTATHRLCVWHLNKNAGDNVNSKEFFSGFKKAMLSNFTPEQFEDFWSELVKKHHVKHILGLSKHMTTSYFGQVHIYGISSLVV